MKICLTSLEGNLDSQLDLRFGRCAYFIIWNSDDSSFEAIANPNINAGSGAGIQSAQLVVSKKVDMVITGEVGPKAMQVLQEANLAVITTESGKIVDIVNEYKNDDKNVSQPVSDDLKKQSNIDEQPWGCVRGAGLGQGCRRGMGRGAGRGMSIGKVAGRGIGRGRGLGGGGLGRRSNNIDEEKAK